ncbi:CotH kinase family protein [Bremerella cremea]|uniref:CotH kinase family protein n=1 Tax=Bremerella cremea TaxID=1031537 RepID=UPI0031E85CA9
MKRSIISLGLLLLVSLFTTTSVAQGPPGFGGPGGPGGPGGRQGGFRGPGGFGGGFGFGGGREDRKLVKEFDLDENGWLDQAERAKAREEAKSEGGGGRRGGGNRPAPSPGPQLAPADVKTYSDAGLYEPTALRTLFFEFENEDWEKELEDFHGTDVEVPAKLTVDGKVYPNVGMRFRGMSSYFMVPTGYKRSFNVKLDLADEDQELLGYKTLNLLNCAGDESLLSTVLYSHIASQYIPVPKVNHVRVVINGESWGVYANVQQFDKTFISEHFDPSKGTRWKVSGSPNGDGGLRYMGESTEEYERRYDMKSNDGKKAWAALIRLCRTLEETPPEKLERELEPLLDIDETLKFLALDVALVNSDGYWTRASDYYLFLDSDKRFHLIPHDMNEAFADGRGVGRGPGGPGGPGGPPRGMGRGGEGPPMGMGRGGAEGPPPGMGPGGFQGPPNREGNRGQAQPGNNPPQGFGPPGGEPNERGFRRGGPGGPGGRGGMGGPGGPGHGGVELDPLVSIDNPRMPLRSKLLAVPNLRKKYLEYVREIAEKSMAPGEIEPVITQHAKLIEADVVTDTRKLGSLEGFQQVTSVEESGRENQGASLKKFFQERRKFLLDYKDPGSARP